MQRSLPPMIEVFVVTELVVSGTQFSEGFLIIIDQIDLFEKKKV